jgi:hypothetical protein
MRDTLNYGVIEPSSGVCGYFGLSVPAATRDALNSTKGPLFGRGRLRTALEETALADAA